MLYFKIEEEVSHEYERDSLFSDVAVTIPHAVHEHSDGIIELERKLNTSSPFTEDFDDLVAMNRSKSAKSTGANSSIHLDRDLPLPENLSSLHEDTLEQNLNEFSKHPNISNYAIDKVEPSSSEPPSSKISRPSTRMASNQSLNSAPAVQKRSWFSRLFSWWSPTPHVYIEKLPTPTLETLLIEHSQSHRNSKLFNSESTELTESYRTPTITRGTPTLTRGTPTLSRATPTPSRARAQSFEKNTTTIRTSRELRRSENCTECGGTQYLPDGKMCSNCADLPPTLYIEESEEMSGEEDQVSERPSSRISTMKRISLALKRPYFSRSSPNLNNDFLLKPKSPALSTIPQEEEEPKSLPRSVRRFNSDNEGGVNLRKRLQFRKNRKDVVTAKKKKGSSIPNPPAGEAKPEDNVLLYPPSHPTLDPGPVSKWMLEYESSSIMTTDLKSNSDVLHDDSTEISFADEIIKSPSLKELYIPTQIDEEDEDAWGSKLFLDGELNDLYKDLMRNDIPLGTLANKYRILLDQEKKRQSRVLSVETPEIQRLKTIISENSSSQTEATTSTSATVILPKTSVNRNSSVDDTSRWSTSGTVLAWMAATESNLETSTEEDQAKSLEKIQQSLIRLRDHGLAVVQ
ncbi:hypothetical protein HK096_007495 [Nowakowskiella sp. JEL0078]|nr:hypothetical protein HK096_007495 [Nowakowskiella sp. JEL0078]